MQRKSVPRSQQPPPFKLSSLLSITIDNGRLLMHKIRNKCYFEFVKLSLRYTARDPRLRIYNLWTIDDYNSELRGGQIEKSIYKYFLANDQQLINTFEYQQNSDYYNKQQQQQEHQQQHHQQVRNNQCQLVKALFKNSENTKGQSDIFLKEFNYN